MRKTKITIIIVSAVFVALIFSFLISVVVLTPKADKIESESVAESCFVSNTSYIDYQEGNDCSAYAAAYVLRSLGEDIGGKDLYPQMKRTFGMMTARSVVTAVGKQGHSAKAYYGNIDTLIQRLSDGVPIICLVNNGKDTHYVVVVGYDNDYIYLVDSIEENTNVSDVNLYNRKVTIGDFEKLWINNFYLVNNVYIVVE